MSELDDGQIEQMLRMEFSGSRILGPGRNLWPEVAKRILDRERISPPGPRWSLTAACAAVCLTLGLHLGTGLGRAHLRGPQVVRVRLDGSQAHLATLAQKSDGRAFQRRLMWRRGDFWEGWVLLEREGSGKEAVLEVSTW